MKVLWTPEALQDRRGVWDFVAEDDPAAAVRLDERFSAAVSRLAEHPRLGKPGLIAGTRELFPHPNYRLVYEIHGEAVWILALAHSARQWPPGEE